MSGHCFGNTLRIASIASLLVSCGGVEETARDPWERCRHAEDVATWTDEEVGACVDLLLADPRPEGYRSAGAFLDERPSVATEARLAAMDEAYLCRADPAGRGIMGLAYKEVDQRERRMALDRRVLVGKPECPGATVPPPLFSEEVLRRRVPPEEIDGLLEARIACAALEPEGPFEEIEACTKVLVVYPTAEALFDVTRWAAAHPGLIAPDRAERLVSVYPCTRDPVLRFALRGMLVTAGQEAALDASNAGNPGALARCEEFHDLAKYLSEADYAKLEGSVPEEEKARLLEEIARSPGPPTGSP